MNPENVLGTGELVIEVESTNGLGAIETGFRVEWLSGGDGEGVEVSLTAGAGVGSPWMNLSVTLEDGTRLSERADASKFVETWMDQAIARHAEREGVAR